MNLRDLAYLVAVADHRHFGRAAGACFVSQPTLSVQIKKLEKELGVALVERGSPILLTPAGEEVVARARSVLLEVDGIRDAARQATDPESGSLRVGVFPTLGPYLLPHVVPKVRERFPELELLLVEEKTERLLRLLRDGKLDAAVLALPVPDDRLHVEPLFEEAFVLAAPATHALAEIEGPAPLSVLDGEAVLLLEDGHCLRDQALSVCRLASAHERSGFRATSLETLRQMVAAGVGVTLLPELAVQPPVPPSAAIALLRFADPEPTRQIAMLWRENDPRSAFLPGLAELFVVAPGDPSAPVAPAA
ncbi:LysR family transcriptional regulator [Aquihabitans sp. G128]|uniref:LysR substrate-binding domain-containing protein n=1 Tax=Aquihabitans sp. G128 TaxID=2849779 RepID=UPI001C24ED13|nr:LysR substrate-binding domain-containing protein [Aquihabitans sp. G128]QXC61852.1 LysR family transcriptional regulator [Aquihabitans sp. G128]